MRRFRCFALVLSLTALPAHAECVVSPNSDQLILRVEPLDRSRPGCNISCKVKTTKSEDGVEDTEVDCTNSLMLAADARCKPTASLLITEEDKPATLSCDAKRP